MAVKIRDEVHVLWKSSPISQRSTTFADKYGQGLPSWAGDLNGAVWSVEKEPLG